MLSHNVFAIWTDLVWFKVSKDILTKYWFVLFMFSVVNTDTPILPNKTLYKNKYFQQSFLLLPKRVELLTDLTSSMQRYNIMSSWHARTGVPLYMESYRFWKYCSRYLTKDLLTFLNETISSLK